MTEQPCPFCEIVVGRAPANYVHEWPDTIAITPLNPVVDGHTLVIPKVHVTDFGEDPMVTATTMHRAAEIARVWPAVPMNLITSRGREATQSVFHLHLHLVPRAEGDGLALPWYSGKKSTGSKVSGLEINTQPRSDDAFARGFAAGGRAR